MAAYKHPITLEAALKEVGGTYGAHQIIDSELVTKNKIYLYTQDDRDDQFRFLIIRKDGQWKIDDCQWHDGGWTKYGL